MNEIKTLRIHCLSTALSPLTHMMGLSGNEQLINRTKIISGGRVCDVPSLSGNALRHTMVRAPGADFIVDACNLRGKLTIDRANFLYYGGSLTDSAIADNLNKIAEMQELLPLYRLLGGSLKNQVLAGSLQVSMGVLVCDENRETLDKLLPDELLYGLPELRSCEDYVSGWQYTRGDAVKKPGLLAPDADTPDKSNLMIYSGQHVVTGAVFYHDFILQNVSRLEVGAVYAAISDWKDRGGAVGGQSRIGHGKLDTVLYCDADDFFGSAVNLSDYEAEYRDHTRANAERITAWLNDTFPAVRPLPKKKAADAVQNGDD